MTQTNRRRSYTPQSARARQPASSQRRPAPRQPQQRRPAAYAAKTLMPTSRAREIIMLLAGGAVVCVLALLLQLAWPNGFPLKTGDDASAVTGRITEIHSSGAIRLNEIMTANSATLQLSDGSTPDWIEIINTGNESVNLSGYSLSKNSDSSNVFTFPNCELAAGECVLVYADSKLREESGEEFHAPFRLSSAGDTLMLFNAGGTAVDTVNIPALHVDSSYARISVNGWEESYMPTPAAENTEAAYRALTEPATDSPIVINEIMASNATTLAAANGLYYDYIELYNRSSETVDLGGWYLSDDVNNARKWCIPDLSLGAGEYLVIFASKLDQRDDVTQLHTNFSLSSEGESVVLANASGRVMDRVDYDLLKTDVAVSRTQDGSYTTSLTPSPGQANQ